MGTPVSGTTHARAGAPDPSSPAREWLWVARVLALVAAFAVIALARSRQVDIPFRDPNGKLFAHKILSTVQTLLLFVVVDVVVRWLRARRDGSTSCGSTCADEVDAVPERDDRPRPRGLLSSSTSATAT